MAVADKYRLVCSAFMGTIYITKISKSDKQVMLDDRREVPKSEFIQAIIEWTQSQLEENQDTVYITGGGERIAEIKLLKK